MVEANFTCGTPNENHYPDLGSDKSSLISKTSFRGEIGGHITKCRHFLRLPNMSTHDFGQIKSSFEKGLNVMFDDVLDKREVFLDYKNVTIR